MHWQREKQAVKCKYFFKKSWDRAPFPMGRLTKTVSKYHFLGEGPPLTNSLKDIA